MIKYFEFFNKNIISDNLQARENLGHCWESKHEFVGGMKIKFMYKITNQITNSILCKRLFTSLFFQMSKVSITLSTTICQVTLKIMFTESVELVEQVLLVLLYLSSPNKTKV